MSLDEIKRTLETCGVVGAGGGGFPAHLKLDRRANTILLNCAECEPLLQVDQQLLARYTHEILSTLNCLSVALDADIVIAVKKSYHSAISAVNDKLQKYSRARLAILDDIYPVGDEIVLIYEALGIVVPPGSRPIDCGCIVFNVETIYNMYYAIEHNRPVTHKWVTIAGEVQRPITALLPLGMLIRDAIKHAGEVTIQNPVFITGGPMMGSIAQPHDEIKKTTNAILVLPFIRQCADVSIALKRASSACCQCRTCTDLCPRHLLGYPIEPHRIMRTLTARDTTSDAFLGVKHCSGCGICETIACPQSLAPRALIKIIRANINQVVTESNDLKSVLHEREGRMVNSNRLKLRLGLAKYDKPAPLEESPS